MQLINIGFGNIVNANRIVSIVSPESAPIKRLVQEAKENKQPIDEGLFGSIFGGLTGAIAGPAIGKAICKALGLDERGLLGNLLTSRLFLTALGGYIGWKQ